MFTEKRISVVSGVIPLVSKIMPFASGVPPITICRFWGTMPSWRWGAAVVPARQRRKVGPIDVGLRGIFTGPKILVETILKQIKEQAEYEREKESKLKQKLLDVKRG